MLVGLGVYRDGIKTQNLSRGYTPAFDPTTGFYGKKYR